MFLAFLTVGLLLAAFLAVVETVTYAKSLAEDTNRPPSPNLWKDCPVLEILEDQRKGFYYFTNFLEVAQLTTPTITTQAYYGGGWKAFGSSGGTLIGAFIEGGMGLVGTETDDNEGFSFATLALPFKISRSNGRFWWEARLKVNTITDLDSGFIAGLWEQTTLTVTDPIAAAGTLADHNFVGFHRLEADGDQLDQVYKANGVTQVTVKADCLGDCPTTTALTANSYIKLGMKYDPSNAYKFSWFINGFELPNYKAIPSADGTDFPNDVQMGLMFALLCGSSNDSILTVDWVRAAQEYAGF